MTVEQLMKPRYKVIAIYPGGYDIDTILYVDEHGELFCKIAGYHSTVVRIMQNEVSKYPFNIKPLQWWEEREEKDMPRNLKEKNGNKVLWVYKHFHCAYANYRHGEHFADANNFLVDPNFAQNYSFYLPATREEYEAYIATLKQNS